MNPEPRNEHAWLQMLVGEWTFESEAAEPGKEIWKSSGTQSIRAIGGLWVQGEMQETMDGQPVTNVITLGFDPAKKRFVGTFVSSMTTHLWVYDGALDGSGKELVLDSEGPTMDGSAGTAEYQDIVEIRDADTWLLRSRMKADPSHEFMKMTFLRKR